jgi:ferredoxin-NADP reductase
MSASSSSLKLRVQRIEWIAEDVLEIEVRGETDLPAFTSGSHIDVHLPNGISRSYSLVNDPADRSRYCIGVGMDPKSRGGSRHIHTQLRPGQIIEVDPPLNNFVLDESAEHTVLIAGGIGITPIFSHARKLAQLQKEFEVYQAARERSRAAYCEKLEEISPMYHLHIDDENQGQFLDIPGIVQQQTPKTHLYCCGPPAMMQSFEAAVAEIPESQVHVEYFVARSEAEQGQSGDFFLGLARSGREFLVPADRSALEVLLENGVTISNSCQEGICGSCETRVLEGTPDHRDSVLSKAEKLSNKTVMLCVSRCQGERMVVDL